MKNTWSTINSILYRKKVKKCFPEYFVDKGDIVNDKVTIANKFNSYFTNIGPNLAKNIVLPQNKCFRSYLSNPINNRFRFMILLKCPGIKKITILTKTLYTRASVGL